MQENDNSEPSPDILTAETIIYEADTKILSLFREFKHQGYPLIQYPFVNERDEVNVVTISGSELRTPSPSYIVATGEERYKLDVSKKWNEELRPHQTAIKVKVHDKTLRDYVVAEDNDVIKLAEVLHQLDADAIRKEMQQVVRDKNIPRAKKIGRLLGRRDTT